MGLSKRLLRLGLLLLLLVWAVGLAWHPVRIASDRDDDDDGSGHWEGIAMAQLDSGKL